MKESGLAPTSRKFIQSCTHCEHEPFHTLLSTRDFREGQTSKTTCKRSYSMGFPGQVLESTHKLNAHRCVAPSVRDPLLVHLDLIFVSLAQCWS